MMYCTETWDVDTVSTESESELNLFDVYHGLSPSFVVTVWFVSLCTGLCLSVFDTVLL